MAGFELPFEYPEALGKEAMIFLKIYLRRDQNPVGFQGR
jgi:hypothetical protein